VLSLSSNEEIQLIHQSNSQSSSYGDSQDDLVLSSLLRPISQKNKEERETLKQLENDSNTSTQELEDEENLLMMQYYESPTVIENTKENTETKIQIRTDSDISNTNANINDQDSICSEEELETPRVSLHETKKITRRI